MAVVMDYQNIHLSARDSFSPFGTPARETLVHPVSVADELALVWNQTQPEASVALVRAFRGQPSNHHQPELYRATQRQQSWWTRDPRLELTYRTLRYSSKPSVPPREKGVDVLVALNFVKLAESGDFDVVVLASHDTDLEPALEAGFADGHATVATGGWDGCKRLRVRGESTIHLALPAGAFLRSRDRREYY